MPRVNYVLKATARAEANGWTCSEPGCTTKIVAGHPYKWIKFRYGGKRVKCATHNFRASEMTQSKMSQVYAAQEAAEADIAVWDDGDISTLADILVNMASEVTAVADEYREAAEAMGGAGEESESKADELESWADELEEWSGEDFDDEETPEARQQWAEDQRDNALEVVNNCPI